jgi:hypothetical protein
LIADLVARLIASGTPPDVAAMVVAEAFAAGVSASIPRNSADVSADNRREKDRIRKQIARGNPRKSADVHGNPQMSENASLSKKESNQEESKKERGVTRASQLPDGWLPDEHVWQATVSAIGLDRCNSEFTKFKNHAADKGRVSKNWNSAWRNWVDRAIEYGAKNVQESSNNRANQAAVTAPTRDTAIIAGMGRALEKRRAARDAADPGRQDVREGRHPSATTGTDAEPEAGESDDGPSRQLALIPAGYASR